MLGAIGATGRGDASHDGLHGLGLAGFALQARALFTRQGLSPPRHPDTQVPNSFEAPVDRG